MEAIMEFTAVIKNNKDLYIPNVFDYNPAPTVDVDLSFLSKSPFAQNKASSQKLSGNAKKILAFAGLWQDMDEDILSPTAIVNRRQKSVRED